MGKIEYLLSVKIKCNHCPLVQKLNFFKKFNFNKKCFFLLQKDDSSEPTAKKARMEALTGEEKVEEEDLVGIQ